MWTVLLHSSAWAGQLDGELAQGLALREAESGALLDWIDHHAPDHADEATVVVVVEGSEIPDGDLLALAGEPGDYRSQLRVPWSALGDLAVAPGVERVRIPRIARPQQGLDRGRVVTEGLPLLFGAGDWGEARIRGQHERIAILDVGFAGYARQLGRELPETVQTDFANGLWETYDHGVSVAEIVHDVAPDAELSLYQFLTDVEFEQAVERMIDDDPDVVNASIGFDNIWAADGESHLSKAVDRLVRKTGAVWVNAAGNEGMSYRHGPLTDIDSDGILELGGLEDIRLLSEDEQYIVLRWQSSSWNLDFLLINEAGEICAEANWPQPAQAPALEVWGGVDCVGPTRLRIVEGEPTISFGRRAEGDSASLYAYYGLAEADRSPEGSLTVPADARGAIAVGACDVGTGAAPDWSSRGPTEDGSVKPDLCAPFIASTATAGAGAFIGTSAAAPLVTGLAALIIDGEGLTDDPEAVREALQAAAQDFGEPGQDTTFGWGAPQMGEAPRRCGCAQTGGAAGGTLLTGILALLSRRRAPRPKGHPA